MRWLALLLTLGGCATAAPPPAVCPAMATYTAEQQAQAADELEKIEGLHLAPVIGQMITDYGQLRAQVRACRGEQP